jgi:hypothetical protein
MAKQTSKMATPAAGKKTTTKPPSPKKSKKTPNMREKPIRRQHFYPIATYPAHNPFNLSTMANEHYANEFYDKAIRAQIASTIISKKANVCPFFRTIGVACQWDL